MMNHQGTRTLLFSLLCLTCSFAGWSQPTLDPDLKKPPKYENRILRAEKTGEKKFNVPRRFFQNTYTHYNYYFNAQTKLDQVLENARAQHLDRYTELLSFYNYSLENTSGQRTELDSVIYKVNAGVFLHDLRSDWMDNLYLLMGQAYYYRNTLDSAFMTFQYMNYAFFPKDPDGYDRVIASNANEGGNVMKVASVEKRNIVRRTFSEPPSRNDALIWLIRTQITRNQMDAAATLIQTLRNDPTFPRRLAPSLDEVTAYWFYNRPQYDSAAFYLEKALPVASGKPELARWEYLLGQLYALAGKPADAKAAFQRCIKHTMNPIMEVAAQLQATQQISSANDVDWQAAIAALEKMARKERYTTYRDLIYYTIARIEIRRELYPAAKAHLHKSIKYNQNNPEQKALTYRLLADLSFDLKEYVPSKQYYDSVETGLLAETDAQMIDERKQVLEDISKQYFIIKRQDSLLHLASLPEAERKEILTKYLRQMRKQRGWKEEETAPQAGGPVFVPAGTSVPTDLFTSYNSGEWYFYNNSLKSRGYTDFRNKWGNRPNTDNWRRSSSVSNVTLDKQIKADVAAAEEAAQRLDLETLTAGLPLTPAQQQVCHDSILQAQFLMANTVQNSFEDYSTAATNYEQLLERFPSNKKEAEILYNLAICYRMLGKTAEWTAVKDRLASSYPGSREARLAADPALAKREDSTIQRNATETYNSVYNLFLEGKFEEALTAKASADSLYGAHHWTPQLLYIEAIYHVKRRADDQAIGVLQLLAGQFPDHPIAEKASNMISVLQRRSEIEDYLSKLEIQRPAEDTALVVTEPEKVPEAPAAIAEKPQPDAADSLKAIQPAKTQPVVVKAKPGPDSLRLQKEAPITPPAGLYNRHAEQPHFVVIVLENVDPVYVNETRNAFTRYNKENYYTVPMNVTVVSLTDQVKMVAVKGLANEKAARDYIIKAKEQASKDIIPWLKTDKYYFLPVAESNMDLLMNSKDLPAYRNFLKQLFPTEF